MEERNNRRGSSMNQPPKPPQVPGRMWRDQNKVTNGQ